MRGGRAAGLFAFTWLRTFVAEGEWEMGVRRLGRESGSSDAERREAVNTGSCIRWQTVESGRQIDNSRRWEVAPNSAEHRGIHCRQDSQSERGGLAGLSLNRLSGRGVDTAEQAATAVRTTRSKESISVLLSDDDVTFHKWQRWWGGTGCLKWAAQVCQGWIRTRNRLSDSTSTLYVCSEPLLIVRACLRLSSILSSCFDTCLCL